MILSSKTKTMKILLAPDSFKDSLSAKKVAEAIRTGILHELPEADMKILPMADGGEGTVEALVDATRGNSFEVRVEDALRRDISAKFGILGDKQTAVIEMASASGIEHLKPEERNPWRTTSFGTGQLIRNALDKKCRRIIIGIGGSATNDGGVGMAIALGAKFIDKSGNEKGIGGGELLEISSIDLTELDKRISETEFLIACDVSNPLTGPQGAAYVYAPQKGADKKMVEKLDRNLKHLASVIEEQLKRDVENIPGAGAAGGLGAGLLAFLDAKLMQGFEIVRRETQLDDAVKWADLVITGEGKIDVQTQYGKTPMGVAGVAKKFNKPVIAIAGTLGEGYQELYPLGFDAILSIMDKPMELKEALINAPYLIERCVRSAIRMFLLK
jgi:glycerate kinase